MNLFGKNINPRWLAAAAGILAGFVLMGYYLFPGKPDIPPEKAITKALYNTMNAKSYEYSVSMYTTIDGQEQQASSVQGARESAGRIHVKGRIFDAEVDFYQLDSITYNKDQLTGKWVKYTDNQINQQEIFMGELNPIASFTFKELNQARYAGAAKEDGQTLWVVKAAPVIDNPYLELFWKDFEYEFWLEPRSYRISKARVTAVSKTSPDNKMELKVEFRNYNGDITLRPPI